jgi:GntR family transcriptional repressor for pyruvate dehydrogenase complex
MRKEILSSEGSRLILNDAHNEMMKSLITKDKNLAYQAINKHFGIVDEKLREIEARQSK